MRLRRFSAITKTHCFRFLRSMPLRIRNRKLVKKSRWEMIKTPIWHALSSWSSASNLDWMRRRKWTKRICNRYSGRRWGTGMNKKWKMKMVKLILRLQLWSRILSSKGRWFGPILSMRRLSKQGQLTRPMIHRRSRHSNALVRPRWISHGESCSLMRWIQRR